MARAKGDPSDTGIVLNAKQRLPVPTQSPPREPKVRRGGLGRKGALATAVVIGLVGGAVAGFVVRPRIAPDPQVTTLAKTIAETQRIASTERDKASALATELDKVSGVNKKIEAELASVTKEKAVLADKAADADKEMSKLKTAMDKAGSVSADGEEITLQLVDKVLFKLGDDQLTDRGKQVLSKVGAALVELPDKQIWVQGHTDDTPIVVPPLAKKAPKGTPPPVPKFASNWELSAARALTVVHYLQDIAKLDPSRLAALAFGQYRPMSRSNRALNRRIEIVLYPHKARIRR